MHATICPFNLDSSTHLSKPDLFSRSVCLPIPHLSYNMHHTTTRSRSSLGMTSRRSLPSTAASDCGNSRDDNDDDINERGNNNQLPPDTPNIESSPNDDRHRPTSSGGGEVSNSGREEEPVRLLGKGFDEEVERQRAQEVAAEWARKRGSGEKTKTRDKVDTRHPRTPPQEVCP